MELDHTLAHAHDRQRDRHLGEFGEGEQVGLASHRPVQAQRATARRGQRAARQRQQARIQRRAVCGTHGAARGQQRVASRQAPRAPRRRAHAVSSAANHCRPVNPARLLDDPPQALAGGGQVVDQPYRLAGEQRQLLEVAGVVAQRRIRAVAVQRPVALAGDHLARDRVRVMAEAPLAERLGQRRAEHPHRRTRRPVDGEGVGVDGVLAAGGAHATLVVVVRVGLARGEKGGTAVDAGGARREGCQQPAAARETAARHHRQTHRTHHLGQQRQRAERAAQVAAGLDALRDDHVRARRRAAPRFLHRADLMRGLAEGSVDIALMYTPEARPGPVTELLFEERLVMVATTRDIAPQPGRGYVHVDWGPEFQARLAMRWPDAAPPALTVAIGWLGLQYLLANGGSGYFPERLVRAALAAGRLHRVRDAESFRLPAWLVYPQLRDPGVTDPALALLRGVAAAQD